MADELREVIRKVLVWEMSTWKHPPYTDAECDDLAERIERAVFAWQVRSDTGNEHPLVRERNQLRTALAELEAEVRRLLGKDRVSLKWGAEQADYPRIAALLDEPD